MPRRARRAGLWAVAVTAVVGVGVAWVLSIQAPTRQGVNFRISTRMIPSYVKVIDFLHRHYQHQLLAQEITDGSTSDHARVLAAFNWTRQHIRPSPPGWDVMDDHILHVIIRGHGEGDQMADVFTTLATYAGVTAFWQIVSLPENRALILSFVRLDGRWVPFDVAGGATFTDRQGRWVDVIQLLQHPEELRAAAAAPAPGGVPYWRYFEQLEPFKVPDPMRARLQMPWPRLVYMARRALGLAPSREPRPARAEGSQGP
jgi:hypothetical protein